MVPSSNHLERNPDDMVEWIVAFLSNWGVFIIALVLSLSFLSYKTYCQASRLDWINSPEFCLSRTLLPGHEAEPNPLPRIYPTPYADSYPFVRNAQTMVQQGLWRLRHVGYDNNPNGYEMHWSNLLNWWLIFLGWCHQQATGMPLIPSIDYMAMLASPILHGLLVVFLGILISLRFSGWVGAVSVIGMVSMSAFNEPFDTGYADHHSLILAAGLCSVLFLLLGGCGWVSGSQEPCPVGFNRIGWLTRKQSRNWFIAAAVAGAMGMWISAFGQIFFFVAMALGAIASTLLFVHPSEDQRVRYDPTLWRVWGTVGAVLTLLFYLLEYFPNHFEMRLEVNHPLFALAWWGGGEILYRLTRRLQEMETPTGNAYRQWLGWAIVTGLLAGALLIGAEIWHITNCTNTTNPQFIGKPPNEVPPAWYITGMKLLGALLALTAVVGVVASEIHYWFNRPTARPHAEAAWQETTAMVLSTAAILLPGIVILLAPRAWFVFHDSFLIQLHQTIYEFQPITFLLHLASKGGHTDKVVMQFFNITPFLILPVAGLLFWKTVPSAEKGWLTLVLVVGVIFMGLVGRYMRWGIVAPGPMLVLLVALMAMMDTWRISGRLPGIPQTVMVGLMGIMLWIVPFDVLKQVSSLKEKTLADMSRDEAVSIVIREVARDIRATSKTQPAVVLSSPNATVRLMQQGGLQGIGSLYWWNVEGLKAAAEMYGEQDDATAEKIFRKHGVTHWAIISEDDYIEGYFNLYKGIIKERCKDLNPSVTLERSLACRLAFRGEKSPPWLRRVPVILPPYLSGLNLQVVIFEVLPPTGTSASQNGEAPQ